MHAPFTDLAISRAVPIQPTQGSFPRQTSTAVDLTQLRVWPMFKTIPFSFEKKKNFFDFVWLQSIQIPHKCNHKNTNRSSIFQKPQKLPLISEESFAQLLKI